jgi:predicted metal-dependent hydrolase
MFNLRRIAPASRIVYEDLEVAGRAVEIKRRPYKRSLALTVKMNGKICVSAPKGVSTAKIRDFVLKHGEWIDSNLSKYEVVRQAYPKKRMVEGEMFPFLGEALSLTFEPCAGKPRFEIRDGKLVCGVRREVWHGFDPHAPHPELLQPLAAFYKAKARDVLSESVQVYASRLNLFPRGVSFRAQRTRWGSCSSRGRISLNWKMIIAPRDVVDYVVIHELSHLKHYNHSSAFWSLVETQSPLYLAHRDWLKKHLYEADFLSSESELHPSDDLA